MVVAAGRSTRLKARVPKPYLGLSAGRNMIDHALAAFRRVPGLCFAALVTQPAYFKKALRSLDRAGLTGAVVEGGPYREDSVLRGLLVLPEKAKTVLVHDAARPFVSPALVARVLKETARCGACVPALPVKDTIKEVGPSGRVTRTLDRSKLVFVQTPQGFRLSLLLGAFLKVGKKRARLTDDASVAETAGYRVGTVEGDPHNFKITTPSDLVRARQMLKHSPQRHQDTKGRKGR